MCTVLCWQEGLCSSLYSHHCHHPCRKKVQTFRGNMTKCRLFVGNAIIVFIMTCELAASVTCVRDRRMIANGVDNWMWWPLNAPSATDRPMAHVRDLWQTCDRPARGRGNLGCEECLLLCARKWEWSARKCKMCCDEIKGGPSLELQHLGMPCEVKWWGSYR